MSSIAFKDQSIEKIGLASLPRLMRCVEKHLSRRLKQRIDHHQKTRGSANSILKMDDTGILTIGFQESDLLWLLLLIVSDPEIQRAQDGRDQLSQTIRLEVTLDINDLTIKHHANALDANSKRIAETLSSLYDQLDTNHQIVLAGRIAGLSDHEIARNLDEGCGLSARSVSKSWTRIKQCLIALGH